MTGQKILIIDDDRHIRQLLKDRLTANSFRVLESGNGQGGLELTALENPSLILLDLKMKGMQGLEVLNQLQEKCPDIPVIILTAHGTIERAVQAMKRGAVDFLLKPCEPDHILVVVRKALEQQHLLDENRLLREEVDSEYRMVVGNSDAMKKVMDLAGRYALTDTTVLIGGETGTGKQLLARAIHRNNDRRKKPFVHLNCTTLSERLLESDLFGHEAGAFTDAREMKRGRVELADGGTLFLDEIGDLAPSLQAKLLHFLEYGEFVRVGGIHTLQVDARILAATNKNLEKEVQEGHFREDLYYRLNVLSITLPPLRDRLEDLPLLIEYFLERFSTVLKKHVLTVPPETLKALKSYDWPGNVRELANAMERAVVLADGETITPDLIPVQVFRRPEEDITVGLSLEVALRRFKAQFIEKTLRSNGYNQTRTAEVLDIQRTYLNRLIKELEIPRELAS